MEAGSMNVLITGTNRGLGLEMVRQIVKGSIPVKKLIACCRDPDGPRAEVSSAALRGTQQDHWLASGSSRTRQSLLQTFFFSFS